MSINLTPTSYVVLGQIERLGPTTPYDLKRAVSLGLGNFWSFPHTQLYTEPERLAEGGLLTVQQEESGRRRKLYSLTPKGRKALDEWRAEPTGELPELRDLSLLKLFFGADPASIARMQLEAHEQKLAEYEAVRERDTGEELYAGPRLTLNAGIAHEREWIRFWRKLAGE